MDTQSPSDQKRMSPTVDCSPLTMDKNRESLKIKLMVRRSPNQLVEQGILPPLKTSPAIHEQKKLLERAKTGDLLKAKIQQRPNREELERRHILNHEHHIDPSLADKYRMLEKAILVDQLNSKISHRPGPLELIEKNILHADEPIERIVKEGLVTHLVPFSTNSEKTPENGYANVQEDSQSSEGDANSQAEIKASKPIAENLTCDDQLTDIEKELNPSIIKQNIMKLNLAVPCTSSFKQNNLIPKLALNLTNHCSENEFVPFTIPISAESIIGKPHLIVHDVKQMKEEPDFNNSMKETTAPVENNSVFTHSENNIKSHISSFMQNNQKLTGSGKEKNRKKCKIKPSVKTRAIKFHEYKGPPNAYNKSSSSSQQPINKKVGETNYELIMKQQCLLEYLEGIYKSPNVKKEDESSAEQSNKIVAEKVVEKQRDERKFEENKKPHITIFPSKAPHTSPTNVISDTVITDVIKLGKLKVSELKMYLKKLNLPVSGPKPLLIERLKPYLPLKQNQMNIEKYDDNSLKSSIDVDETNDQDSLLSSKEEDIVREQQRKIEELQRKLLESQNELNQIKQSKSCDSFSNNEDISDQETLIRVVHRPQNNAMFDSKCQLPSQISTVFVVGVPQSPILLAPEPANVTSMPLLLNKNTEDIKNNNTMAPLIVTSPKEDSLKGLLFNSTPAVQDDINDVIEILLKNEKWTNNVGSENFHACNDPANTNADGALSHNNEIVTIFNDTSQPMSPLLSDNSMEVTLATINSSVDLAPFKPESDNEFTEYPMEIEENSNLHLNSNDFHHHLHTSLGENDLSLQTLSNHSTLNYPSDIGKIHLADPFESEKKESSACNGVKNSLIGNFDNNLFDTFRNGTLNNAINATNNIFSSGSDLKEQSKDQDKNIFNNLSILNNLEIFGNASVEESSVPMDFENIISYDLYHHDPSSFFNDLQTLPEENFINNNHSFFK